MIFSLIVFLVILSILVIIHELGHFLTAKKFGIKVEEFGFGFPPRALGKKIGETLYSINWLPIGGFVKLYGEDEAGGGSVQVKTSEDKEYDLKRAFFARPAWQRAVVILAGVVMNLFLAALIFYTYFLITGFKAEIPLIGDYKFFGVNQANLANVVGFVEKGSPADQAGMRPPLKIIKVAGITPTATENVIKIISENRGRPTSVDAENLITYKMVHFTVTPRKNPPKGQGPIGIALDENAELTYATPIQKLFSGFIHPINLMAYNLYAIKKVIEFSFASHNAGLVTEGFSGPVGIYRIITDLLSIPDIKERFTQVLNLAGLLSISLAFFNVLPIPALDGGRLFFILIELVTRRKVPAKYETAAHAIGLAVLLCLILLITFFDVVKLIPGQTLLPKM